MNYYNENDPDAAGWLRNLIKAKLIPDGYVDGRSIKEVKASDLTKYTQCHFFAGIGGWPYALQLAGWRPDEPVWTGSCPCQPFSDAGKKRGEEDPRHLWPEFRRLIADGSPAIVFGEQVAGKDGRKWLTGVRADLEALGYAVGAADLCAAGVSAPHPRQRLYWLADSGSTKRGGGTESEGECGRAFHPEDSGIVGRMAYASDRDGRCGECGEEKGTGADGERRGRPASRGVGCWSDFAWIPCGDGKTRRIKPGLAPLVDGFPGRVAQLRAWGNAIVPELAAEFIISGREAMRGLRI